MATLLVPVGASAAAFTVTTPAELQAAINVAESTSGPSTISLAPGVYNIGNDIGSVGICGPSDITMIGAGASSTILDGDFSGNPVVDVGCSGGTTTLENVTIQNSGTNDGIYANGSLFVLRDSVVSNNGSFGIESIGTATVSGSTIVGNGIVGNGAGGLWIETAASVVNSTIANNKGPGIAGAGGTLTNVTIAGNGGGIRVQATLTLVNTIVAGNPGGDCNTYAYTTTSANFTQPAVNSTVSVTVSTTAWMAVGQQLWVTTGGYYNVSSITDSTHVVLINLGYANAAPGATVSAGSAVVDSGDSRGIVSGGHNLASDTSCPFTAVSDQNSVNPLLGPLADNGGPTPTMALGASSPAIDAGDDALCPSTDQRGVTRPQGPHCDIGAYELTAPAGNTPIGSPVTVSLPPVTVTFANVTQAGDTTVATSTTGPPPPTGYFIAAGATYYTVSTTAVWTTTSGVVVCITDPSITATSVLLHYNPPPGGMNVTDPNYPIGTTICSIPLTALSPFVIAVPVTVTVPQTITFGALAPMTLGDPPFSVSATASSGLAVIFAASGGACTVSGSLLTITGAGSCTITASQAGNANFSAATPVSQTFSIGMAGQTITFGPLGPKTFGDAPFSVSATASSGLTVSFAASGNCTVAVNLVTITGAGSCTITASQGGDANFNAAPDVPQSFTVAITVGRPPFIIPAGDTASFTNPQFGACNNLSWGYQLNGGTNVVLYTKPLNCDPGAQAQYAGPNVTIGPFATPMTLLVFLTDITCGITYYSDGTPVDHVIVSGSNPYFLRFADAGGSCERKFVTLNTFTGFNFQVNLTIADAPLTAGTLTLTGGTEGSSATTASFTFTDPDLNSTAADYTATISWGDGISSAGTVSGSGGNFTVSGSHTYTEEGSYIVTVTVTDGGGSTTSGTGTVTVADAPLTAGTLSLTGGTEGLSSALPGSGATTASFDFTDANPCTNFLDFTATISWGDATSSAGLINGVCGRPFFTAVGYHTYAEEGSYTVTVTVTDDGGSTTSATGTVTVADAPLTAGTLSLTGGTEGLSATTASFTFTDANPGSTVADFTATISWGDGTSSAGTISGPAGGLFTVSGSHTYAEEGPHTVTVTVTDDGGSTTSATGIAHVADAALTAVCAAPANFTQSFSGPTATFTDANPGSTVADFTATIDWGDTTSSAGLVSGPSGGLYTVSGSHTYATTGYFTIKTSIIDDGGATATASCKVLTFAFAPGGGSFVIGDHQNSAIGNSVTFWDSTWLQDNSLSSGPHSFKGFAQNPTTPSCGVGWSADTGNSTPPPAGPLPAFMGVIVTSSATQSGSTVSGNTVYIVIVQTNPGYAPDPGHAGTGKVVAAVC